MTKTNGLSEFAAASASGARTTREGKTSNWTMHNSLKLAQTAGQVFSDDAYEIIKNMTHKWTYYTRLSDNGQGNMIIKFYTKKSKDEAYIIVDTQSGAIIDNKSFDTLADAKDYMDLVPSNR